MKPNRNREIEHGPNQRAAAAPAPVLVLDQLEPGQWAAELLASQRISECCLIGGDRVAQGLPGDGLPGLGQHIVGVVPGPGLRQTGTGGHPHPVQADLGLPHAAVRGFTDDLPGVIPGDRVLRALGVFHDESTDLAVVVAGPDDHHVGDRAVADPPLVPVQHPLVTLPPRPGFQRNHVGAVLGFGQRKGAESFTGRHPWQILGLLLFGAQHRDGRHREPGMYGVQGGDAAIAAGQFGGDHAFE